MTNNFDKFFNLLANHPKAIVAFLAAVTILFGLGIPRGELDYTLQAFYVTDSPEYRLYRKFVKRFGDDEFILIAIKFNTSVLEPSLLKSLGRTTRTLAEQHKISEVLSLTNLRVFGQRKGVYGTYSMVKEESGRIKFHTVTDLDRLRRAFPITNLLVSLDRKTVGIAVKFDERWKFDPDIRESLHTIREIVAENCPDALSVRLIGHPDIREAFLRYNLYTGLTFGILAFVIILLTATFLFRSLRVTIAVGIVTGLSMLWVAGLMSWLGIRLNTATALSFGIIPVVAAATIIHIVTHYVERSQNSDGTAEAVRDSLRIVGFPCFMCAVTTSIGFGSIMISQIPMVRQVGLILSLGVGLTFILAILLTPALLVIMKPVSRDASKAITRDYFAGMLKTLGDFLFSHPKLCVMAGTLITAFMAAGIPSIRVSTDPLAQFYESSSEVQDLRFVERNLSAVRRLELYIEGDERTFKKPEVWKQISDIQTRLIKIPYVVRVDSLLPTLEYIHETVSDRDGPKQDLFGNAKLIPQLIFVTRSGSGGKRLVNSYINEDNDASMMRVSVWLRTSSSATLEKAITNLQSIVDTAKLDTVRHALVTGVLAIYSAQISDLVKSQVVALIVALSLITLMIVVQLRSLSLGLLAIVPNALPVVTIFGIMGWFGISLNSMTVFAATASIGLAVDDTIHFLTQLRRQIQAGGEGGNIETCLRNAYRISARALTSTSLVLCLGFLTLLLSPFRPVSSFGALLSCGAFAALIGDLAFLPGIILTFPFITRMLNRSVAIHISQESSSLNNLSRCT